MKMKNQSEKVLVKDAAMGEDEKSTLVSNSPEGTNTDTENPAERKVKLYWTKRIEDKAFTMGVLKEGEVFKKTKSVHTLSQDGDTLVTTPIYSLNRGRRSYYAIDLTEEEVAASQKEEDDEAIARQQKLDKRKEEHKAELEKRAAERKARRSGTMEINTQTSVAA